MKDLEALLENLSQEQLELVSMLLESFYKKIRYISDEVIEGLKKYGINVTGEPNELDLLLGILRGSGFDFIIRSKEDCYYFIVILEGEVISETHSETIEECVAYTVLEFLEMEVIDSDLL